MTYPTRDSLTLLDIAKLGAYFDEYHEKFRGTTYDGTPEKAAYEAAHRVISGEYGFFDEEMVRSHYEKRVREDFFTKSGELGLFFKNNVYKKID